MLIICLVIHSHKLLYQGYVICDIYKRFLVHELVAFALLHSNRKSVLYFSLFQNSYCTNCNYIPLSKVNSTV